jgi:P4 family phage/plasmid primase-like protien
MLIVPQIYLIWKEANMKNAKVNILYSRLSRDDELHGPSNSIVNQQELLQEYAERNNLMPYIHIVDDGYSGTRWDRPGWQELIAKVEADEVFCVCIKDGSRLGRDYLRVGLYRELFREKNVRLIAINDNYDSNSGDDDFTPFREIMAEWYARDTSRKIKSVFATKAKSGKPTASSPPYGFIKDPNDKNKWLVDPEAAEIVKRIFQMTIDGMGVHTIAGVLAREKVERPSYYLGSRGLGRHKNDYDRENRYAWESATISIILKRMEYCGFLVNLRTSSACFKSNKKKNNPKEDWLIFENHHEAIISQEIFDTVQKLRETPRRFNSCGEVNPLTGLLFCSDCEQKLYNHRKSQTQKPTHKKLTDVLGDYARTIQTQTLSRRSTDGSAASPDIARLKGARLVNMPEPEKGLELNIALVKQLTGGDTYTGRFLNENPIEFRPEFKIYINTNHLPRTTDDTIFSSGRVKLIPFDRHFNQEEQDNGLKEQFRKKECMSAILNWMIDGYRLLQETGLDMPKRIVDAIATYRQDTDIIGQFIIDRTILKDGYRLSANELYSAYSEWAKDNGYRPMNNKNFVAELRPRLHLKRGNIGWVIIGISLIYSKNNLLD